MKHYLLFAVIIFSNLVFSTSAVVAENQAQPLSQLLSLQPLTENATLTLADIDIKSLQKTSMIPIARNPKNITAQPLQISQTTPINQSIEQLGQWQTIAGQSIWRLQILTKNALHLNLGFKNLKLPESASFFISDAQSGKVLKQYTAKQNKTHGELWTPLFDSKVLLLEINLLSTDRDKLSLELVQAGQGFKAVTPGDNNTKSGACNIDVVCPQGDNWRDEIRSVARYTISTEAGTFFCTGLLVNNTRGDLAPLFLTAAHCWVSDTTAASMVLYWNYETSVCAGSRDGSLSENQNGARLISRWEGLSNNSDFALVELDTLPASTANVYYAGWDNRDQTHTGVVAIHHPAGDEKRISVDNDVLTITAYTAELENPNAHFLRVGEWEEGTTEGGSSGSGLWNMSGHVVGTLSGGLASCNAITEPDWYGRMASHWQGNNFNSNQLAPYLDPVASPATTLDGGNNCAAPTVTITPSTNNPAVAEQISFTSLVSGGAGNYTYSWDFDGDNIVDSTDANPVYTYSSAANNIVTLIVRDSAQCPGIATSLVLAADNTEVFLGDGIIPDGFVKPESATGTWIVDDSRASEGLFSLKSQIINSNDTSSIEIGGSYEAGNISFDRRVSSEDTFDFFKFFIDDVEQFSIAGEQDWVNVSFPVTAGNHTFRWSYEKDDGLSKGQDAAWIDNLQLPVVGTNDPPFVVTAIDNQTNDQGDNVNLDISVNFDDPDGDTLNFTMTDGPTNLSIDAITGVISGSLQAVDASSSPYTVTITASDGAAEISADFTWTVNASAPPPPPPPPPASGGGGTMGLLLSVLLLFAIRRRYIS